MRFLPVVNAKTAWLILFGLVVYHEISCKPGELLSEEVDRQLTRRPWAVWAFCLVTVGHLMNITPPKIDPYHWIGKKNTWL